MAQRVARPSRGRKSTGRKDSEDDPGDESEIDHGGPWLPVLLTNREGPGEPGAP